ncbi:hypothetical protein MFIFM68171_00967 [Madurella fahalii]|uniref:Uncharacterized protein n=1 Tax=Madurella fahalii TaxID=1157608 RepID=A0ABQ0FZ20_9PEZI
MEQPFSIPNSTTDGQQGTSAASSPRRESPTKGSGLRTDREGQSYESVELAPGLAPSFNHCYITNVYYTRGETGPDARSSGRTSVGGSAVPNVVPLSRPRTGIAHQSMRPRTSPRYMWTRSSPLRVRPDVLPRPSPLDDLWSETGNSTTTESGRPRSPRIVHIVPSHRHGSMNPVTSWMGGKPFPYAKSGSDCHCDSCASDCDSSSASSSSCDSHPTSSTLPGKTRRFGDRSSYLRSQHDDLLDRAVESRHRLRDTLEHMRTELEGAEAELEMTRQEIYRLSMGREPRNNSPVGTDGDGKNSGQETGSAERVEPHGSGGGIRAGEEDKVASG